MIVLGEQQGLLQCGLLQLMLESKGAWKKLEIFQDYSRKKCLWGNGEIWEKN